MLRIIPIRDLKNTSEISQKCHSSSDPIFITKNGYGDMVIMSIEKYEETMYMSDVRAKIALSEEQILKGNVLNGDISLKSIRGKYNV